MISGPVIGSMEFSFHKPFVNAPKCEWFDARYAAGRPETITTPSVFHDGENVTQSRKSPDL